jgi:CRISPR-associated endonuclease/helicase Cas3
MKVLVAHSARPTDLIPAQSYRDHVKNVIRSSVENALFATGNSSGLDRFVEGLLFGAEFHDLGKVDLRNQEVLHGNERLKLPINHVDAGVAHLRRLAQADSTKAQAMLLAAWIVYSHHEGLPNRSEETKKGSRSFLRDIRRNEDFGSTKQHTDKNLEKYVDLHANAVCNEILHRSRPESSTLNFTACMLRFALSCLVDADHLDTSLHYQNASNVNAVPLNPAIRLQSLNHYVARLSGVTNSDELSERNRVRSLVYETCRKYDEYRGIVSCDSPVGSGKTTAVMAHLLAIAAKHNLRRIFIVLPFTNIITQSVNVYRNALVLPGETSEHIIAEHHHRAEFTNPDSRHLSFSWQAPVVVTTAIQFFNTLAAADTGSVRKLHHVARSAIFVDESHAALPAHLWPISFRWLRELVDDWNCHVVLGSGSLVEFWKLPDFRYRNDEPVSIPSILNAETTRSSTDLERKRIEYRTQPKRLLLDELINWVGSFEGPRLVIVNTVQSAAVIAKELRSRKISTEHISTSLTPEDREVTLERVRRRLENEHDTDWLLVATSCVEAGVDLSFRIGFRERASLNSLLQTAGRVNRSAKFENTLVWDFQLIHDDMLRPHPAFEVSAIVLGQFFDEGLVSPAYCTEAMKREIGFAGIKNVAKSLCDNEVALECRAVAEQFRIIDSDSVTAVVSPQLLKSIARREKINFTALQRGSVQVYRNRAIEFALDEISTVSGVFRWTLKYDNFLGYMAGVLSSNEFLNDGGYFA